MVGRNYCDQVRTHVTGFLPQLFGMSAPNDDGIGGGHIYIPRFNHRIHKNKDYIRGFGIQCWGIGAHSGTTVAQNIPDFGAAFKQEVKKRYPAWVELHPYGEVLPRPDNRVTVDESRTDRYGVPLMKISVSYGENEKRMLKHMYEMTEEILTSAKAEREEPDPDHSRHCLEGLRLSGRGTRERKSGLTVKAKLMTGRSFEDSWNVDPASPPSVRGEHFT